MNMAFSAVWLVDSAHNASHTVESRFRVYRHDYAYDASRAVFNSCCLTAHSTIVASTTVGSTLFAFGAQAAQSSETA